MNFAWVIDQTRCIGCHACSTACKSENDVPLGVYRTWVKNVEVGTFPNVRRHYAVLRCNHCADPPCVHICPVRAMYQRDDGIVDFDHDRCIGCKACMQACPYDAIHIDPVSNTAAKCHFCAHRVDRGLLPACVVICPVEALVFGDLDDQGSRVSQVLGSTPVSVRRPEQHTRPKAFYVGASEATLDPLAAAHGPAYMWSDRPAGTAKDHSSDFSLWSLLDAPRSGGNGRAAQSRMPTARVAYDVSHRITWRGKVSSYLWTKSIAAGAVFVTAMGALTGSPATTLTRPALVTALLALAATGVLLIADLKRPERFWYILAKPQWRSWLTRGAVIISAYGAVLVALLGLDAVGLAVPATLWGAAAVLAFALAVYTAFLFGQCEARDLWQSPLLGVSLTLQMLVAGSASLLVLASAAGGAAATDALTVMLAWSLVGHGSALVLGEAMARHGSTNAAAAAHVLTRGRYAALFWAAVVGGVVVPIGLVALVPGTQPAAAALALAGLLAYEHAFVMAGQSVPIS